MERDCGLLLSEVSYVFSTKPTTDAIKPSTKYPMAQINSHVWDTN